MSDLAARRSPRSAKGAQSPGAPEESAEIKAGKSPGGAKGAGAPGGPEESADIKAGKSPGGAKGAGAPGGPEESADIKAGKSPGGSKGSGAAGGPRGAQSPGGFRVPQGPAGPGGHRVPQGAAAPGSPRVPQGPAAPGDPETDMAENRPEKVESPEPNQPGYKTGKLIEVPTGPGTPAGPGTPVSPAISGSPSKASGSKHKTPKSSSHRRSIGGGGGSSERIPLDGEEGEEHRNRPEKERKHKKHGPPDAAKQNVEDKAPIPSNDALNVEFSYYCAVLRSYAPSLSREQDRVTTRLWMRKLFGPEYHPYVLKPKRNKYLLYLSITSYNDEAYGIFRQEPPEGKLAEIKDIFFDKEAFPPAAWEMEKQWVETVNDLSDEIKSLECFLHARACPPANEELSGILDAEFQFFLWLAKPYVALLQDAEEKTTAACWIRRLCGLAPEAANCTQAKEIRNDYMQALLGYAHDLRVEGPFTMMPPEGPLPPLNLLYQISEEGRDLEDPSMDQAEEFLALQRLPDCGAFAYINVTGELFGNN